ncbi:MAG TPA: delta-60 repeat domain-containing protein, partial [Pyrinomonadaceae bacterium]
MKISSLMAIAACFITLIAATAIFAAPGSLDTTFYGTGFHRNGFGFGYDSARKVLLQADGKIITVGTIGNGERGTILIVRYLTNGSLDPTFGEGGFVTDGYISPSDAVLQPDGKIVIISSVQPNTNTPTDFLVTRYNPNGTRDMSFGNQGIVTTDFAGQYDRAWGVAVQTDGKIVVAGWAGDGFAVARYNPDGSLDTSFGSGGKKTTIITGDQEGGYAVAIQPDGKIVVVGATIFNGFCFAAVRYLPNGDLDTSFDGDGIAITNTSNSVGEPSSVVIQPDGKILIGGDDIAIVLIRYNPNGSLDTTFGGTGMVRTTIRAQETCNELKL